MLIQQINTDFISMKSLLVIGNKLVMIHYRK